MKIDNELNEYYENNMDQVLEDWETYICENEWGSGEDKIKINDGIFWDFVESHMEE